MASPRERRNWKTFLFFLSGKHFQSSSERGCFYWSGPCSPLPISWGAGECGTFVLHFYTQTHIIKNYIRGWPWQKYKETHNIVKWKFMELQPVSTVLAKPKVPGWNLWDSTPNLSPAMDTAQHFSNRVSYLRPISHSAVLGTYCTPITVNMHYLFFYAPFYYYSDSCIKKAARKPPGKNLICASLCMDSSFIFVCIKDSFVHY